MSGNRLEIIDLFRKIGDRHFLGKKKQISTQRERVTTNQPSNRMERNNTLVGWLVGWLAQCSPFTLLAKLEIQVGSLDGYADQGKLGTHQRSGFLLQTTLQDEL